MKEFDDVLSALEDAERRGDSCLLATLVKVEGSSYRRVGARFLLSASGERTGGVSGGCLESEIAKKAWWFTKQGPVIQTYNTVSDGDTGMPFGLGCNGVLHVLIQRIGGEEKPLLESLRQLRKDRIPAALATVISGPSLGQQRLYPEKETRSNHELPAGVLAADLVKAALGRVTKTEAAEYLHLEEDEVLIEPLPLAQRLLIFGAGDDVRPLVKFAVLLGWTVIVADGRAHMATRLRFPDASAVISGPAPELPAICNIAETDAVVLMTHSYPQDQALLAQLLSRPLRYLGLLGPRQRTARLLRDLDRPGRKTENLLHAPIGLDIGAHTPETIALAIIAEIQSELSSRQADIDLGARKACDFDATEEPASTKSI